MAIILVSYPETKTSSSCSFQTTCAGLNPNLRVKSYFKFKVLRTVKEELIPLPKITATSWPP